MPNLRASHVLSWLVAALLAVVSAGGVFFGEVLYRDNALVEHAFRGQDAVTLFVAVPLLVVALIAEQRGSGRGRLVWLAMLAYSLYGNLFYVFGAAFNAFFLLYVALFALSLYALLFSVPRIDVAAAVAGLPHGATRWVAFAYMTVTALGLGILWTAMSVGFLVTGKVPAPIVATGHPTGVVFGLDLSIIVPAMALGVVWLVQRKPWGWLLAAVMSIKGVVYTLGLSVATLYVQRTGVGSGAELPVWAGLTVLRAVTAAMLLLGYREQEKAVGEQ